MEKVKTKQTISKHSTVIAFTKKHSFTLVTILIVIATIIPLTFLIKEPVKKLEEQIGTETKTENTPIVTNVMPTPTIEKIEQSEEYAPMCIPDNFDPAEHNLPDEEKYPEGNITIEFEESYEISYKREELRNSIQLDIYETHCGYSSLFITYDFYKDGKRLSLFSNITNSYPDEIPVNKELGLYFLRLNSGERYIYSVYENSTVEIETNDCTNLRAYWENDSLVAFSGEEDYENKNDRGQMKTSACIINKEGEIEKEFTAYFAFAAVAPGYAIIGDSGIVNNWDNRFFYVYSDTHEHDNASCYLTIYDLEKDKTKDIRISDMTDKPYNDTMSYCPSIQLDFSTMKEDMSNINWSIKPQTN